MQDEIGSLEVNKKADITLIKSDKVHAIPFENIYSKLVYATTAADVSDVMVDGQWLVLNRELVNDDLNDIIASAKKEIENILN
jgi:5-methylthioadenosine/S-adenosylhomocysteine deaminase